MIAIQKEALPHLNSGVTLNIFVGYFNVVLYFIMFYHLYLISHLHAQ